MVPAEEITYSSERDYSWEWTMFPLHGNNNEIYLKLVLILTVGEASLIRLLDIIEIIDD